MTGWDQGSVVRPLACGRWRETKPAVRGTMKPVRSAVLAVTLLALLMPGAAVGQDVSPGGASDSQRAEADFFAVTFPCGWEVTDAAEAIDGYVRGQAIDAYDPDSRSECHVEVGPGKATSEEELEAWTADLSAFAEVTLVASGVTEVPAGPAATVAFDVQWEGDAEPVAHQWFGIKRGRLTATVWCYGPDRRSDLWHGVAEGYSWSTLDDDVELGWPGVPLTEQQTWNRIGPAPAIARHQLLHIWTTISPDLRWYISCMDRAHEAVDITHGDGWDGWGGESRLGGD